MKDYQTKIEDNLIGQFSSKYTEEQIRGMVSYLIAGGHTLKKDQPYYDLCKAACDAFHFYCE